MGRGHVSLFSILDRVVPWGVGTCHYSAVYTRLCRGARARVTIHILDGIMPWGVGTCHFELLNMVCCQGYEDMNEAAPRGEDAERRLARVAGDVAADCPGRTPPC